MKEILHTLVVLTAIVAIFASCDDTQTYAEQKEYENSCISRFLAGNSNVNTRAIKVISEADFKAQGETTDTAKNEYVLFSSTGVYMQIIDKGCGEKLKNGESADVLCRFTEYNINGDSLQLSNRGSFLYSTWVDKMSVRNSSGTFSASFSEGLMYNCYSSASVPSGWLTPLTYINLGRPASADERIAHVRLIVPHGQGQAYATSSVYACYYDITYERGQ